MPLWRKLYNTVWLAFFSCVLLPRWMGPYAGLPVHVLLGVVMLLVTRGNARRLESLPVPARLKRIANATAGFALFQLVSGLTMGLFAHLLPGLPIIISILRGVHVVCALAILAQASSVATAYDMWEEKEFTAPPDSDSR
jgi:hypothetical protein